MEMNRFLKVIWSVNGVVLLLVFVVAGGFMVKELIKDSLWPDRYYVQQPEIIVGDELEKAKAEGLILQGLTYDPPRRLLHTELYILPVHIKTYENPRTLSKRPYANFEGGAADESFDAVNVIFLNKNFNVETVLLDKKGFIESLRFPGERRSYSYMEAEDTLQRHITYEITFEDSNKDGSMDDQDYSDLYLSDLDGKNLRRITTGVNVGGHYFVDRNQIMIKYTTRDDQPEEHKKEHFALYSIKGNQLRELTSLHETLNKIEDNITR